MYIKANEVLKIASNTLFGIRVYNPLKYNYPPLLSEILTVEVRQILLNIRLWTNSRHFVISILNNTKQIDEVVCIHVHTSVIWQHCCINLESQEQGMTWYIKDRTPTSQGYNTSLVRGHASTHSKYYYYYTIYLLHTCTCRGRNIAVIHFQNFRTILAVFRSSYFWIVNYCIWSICNKW
jgi:hypothetical protein